MIRHGFGTAPLKHISVHVVQAPRVGLLHANLVGVLFTSGVAIKPPEIAQLLFIVAKRKRRLRSGVARILPLFGRWQPVLFVFRKHSLLMLALSQFLTK